MQMRRRMVLEPFWPDRHRHKMADVDREVSGDLWLLGGQKEVLILQLRALANRPNTRGKDRERAEIKRRLDAILDEEKRAVQQL